MDDAALPNFVSIAPFRSFNPAAHGPGFLGPPYAPLIVGEATFGGPQQGAADPDKALQVEDLALPGGIKAERFDARWQLAADAVGFGFAQGKSMLWRRDMLGRAGGIRALGIEIAEDAAATKVVRSAGRRVSLVDRPFEQPLGERDPRQVMDRQLRWARLRRATFPLCYTPEVLTGSLAPMGNSTGEPA